MAWTICGDTPRTKSVPIIKTPRSITWSIASSDTSKAFPQRKHDGKPAYYPMTSGLRKNVKFSLVTCLAVLSGSGRDDDPSRVLRTAIVLRRTGTRLGRFVRCSGAAVGEPLDHRVKD